MTHLILAQIALLLCAILYQVHIVFKQRKKMLIANLVQHHLTDLLTGAKWNAELMMTKDFGKLKISQLQIMDKVMDSLTEAARLYQKLIRHNYKDRELSLDADKKHKVEEILDNEST